MERQLQLGAALVLGKSWSAVLVLVETFEMDLELQPVSGRKSVTGLRVQLGAVLVHGTSSSVVLTLAKARVLEPLLHLRCLRAVLVLGKTCTTVAAIGPAHQAGQILQLAQESSEVVQMAEHVLQLVQARVVVPILVLAPVLEGQAPLLLPPLVLVVVLARAQVRARQAFLAAEWLARLQAREWLQPFHQSAQ